MNNFFLTKVKVQVKMEMHFPSANNEPTMTCQLVIYKFSNFQETVKMRHVFSFSGIISGIFTLST